MFIKPCIYRISVIIFQKKERRKSTRVVASPDLDCLRWWSKLRCGSVLKHSFPIYKNQHVFFYKYVFRSKMCARVVASPDLFVLKCWSKVRCGGVSMFSLSLSLSLSAKTYKTVSQQHHFQTYQKWLSTILLSNICWWLPYLIAKVQNIKKETSGTKKSQNIFAHEFWPPRVSPDSFWAKNLICPSKISRPMRLH